MPIVPEKLLMGLFMDLSSFIEDVEQFINFNIYAMVRILSSDIGTTMTSTLGPAINANEEKT